MSDDNAQTPVAGWYDDDSGRQRYWDGSAWTEHFADEYRAAQAQAQAKAQVKSGHSTAAQEPGVLWSAVGKPLTGIGAGRYKLTADFLYFEKGALSTRAEQIAAHEIHDVDASQTMSQKARGVGTITLHARRARGDEVVRLEDIPEFRQGVTIINQTALDSRNALRTKEQTQTVNYTGGLPTINAGGGSAVQTPAAGDDLFGQLSKIADLHKAGVLTDDEFTSAKSKLLGS